MSALALAALLIGPLQGSRAAVPDPVGVPAAASLEVVAGASETAADVLRPDAALPQLFSDGDADVSFAPPPGWMRGPSTALNPVSDPPEPVHEIARYQMRVGDATLYAAPIAITSGLVADAGAVISLGLARVDGGLIGLDMRARGDRDFGTTPGFVTLDDEAVYEGVHVFTRYFFSRPGDRVVVLRAAAAESDWNTIAHKVMSTAASVRADPLGTNAPAAPLPPPPARPPVVFEPEPDPTVAIRERILSRAKSLLGLRYVWGGNSLTNGMDCSAYVSWTWSTTRYTTDSIWQVSFPITKNELRAGDAMNLTVGRDPQRRGHIRIFEAWANVERTLVWVYEETPPRVVHRVIVYDERYQPIRLAGLSSAGEAKLIPGQPAPTATARAVVTRRPTVTTPRPTVRPTLRPTVRPTVRPTTTLRPVSSLTPRPSAGTAGTATTSTVRPSPTPTRTPLRTVP